MNPINYLVFSLTHATLTTVAANAFKYWVISAGAITPLPLALETSVIVFVVVFAAMMVIMTYADYYDRESKKKLDDMRIIHRQSPSVDAVIPTPRRVAKNAVVSLRCESCGQPLKNANRRHVVCDACGTEHLIGV